MRRTGPFTAGVRSRYSRGSWWPRELSLTLVEPLKIHLRRTVRHSHLPSIYFRIDLPVIAKAFHAAPVERGQGIAGPAIGAARLERTVDRLQIRSAQVVERYLRQPFAGPAAKNLPPLRQELLRPAPAAVSDERAQAAQQREETSSRLAGQAPLAQGRPEFSLDMNRITDQVIRKIDRRVIAARERLGRI